MDIAGDGEVVTVAVAALDERYGRLRLPQPRLERAMAASIDRYGQLSPLVGSRRGDVYAVIDGFKRMHAARALAVETLTITVLSLSERAAVAAVYGMNRGTRGLADLEEAFVVRELVRTHGMTQPEAGELLGRDKSWVCRRLMLVERLDEQVQQDVRVGLVPVTVARELARLPRGNQTEVAAAVHRNALTSRDAATLVSLFEKTVERPQQQAILANPREILDAQRTGPRPPIFDPRLGVAANRMRRQSAQVVEGLAQLQRLLQELPAASCTTSERQVLAPALRQVERLAGQVAATALATASAMEAADGSGS
jgi:ParB-like chromosome segregation protein Spo0J